MLRKLLLIAIMAVVMSFIVSCSDSKDDGIPVVSKSYNVKYEGPGGHSNGAYGNVNAVHAASRSIMALETADIPAKLHFSGFTGGNSVNSIAATAEYKVTVTGSTFTDFLAVQSIIETAAKLGAIDENAFRKISEGQTNSNGGRIDVRATVTEIK